MEHASLQTRSRMWMLALSGVVAAFAWVILSVVLGFGAATAHADDSDGSGGLLDGVTTAEVVVAVPVVGEVTSGLAVGTARDELAGTADRSAGAVIELPGRVIAAAPGIGLSESASASDRAAIAGATRAALETEASAAGAPAMTFRAMAASLTSAATVVAVAVAGGPAGSFPDLVSGMSPLASSISSPGGAGLGMGALLALGLFVAHRAWVRRNGLENDQAPPAPAFLTDVSPD